MKINGQDVDMQKVVIQYEREHKKKKKGGSNQLWWDSQAGMIQKEKLSARLRELHEIKQIHCHKIKYVLINTENEDDKQLIYGQVELAKFLGYKSFNSNLRYQMIANKKLSNKSKTKIYDIEEIL